MIRSHQRSFALGVALLACLATLLSTDTVAHADSRPNQQQIQFAQRTSDLMLATLFAALLAGIFRNHPSQCRGRQEIDLPYLQRQE